MTNRVFGERSTKALVGVHPNLIQVVKRALEICEVDFTVIEGLRTEARQKELWAKGRTAPGPKVTWTMNSKHKRQTDGWGHAVDLAHISGGQVIWTDAPKIAKAMLAASAELKIPIRWGGNWDGDDRPGEKGETDGPHFELATT